VKRSVDSRNWARSNGDFSTKRWKYIDEYRGVIFLQGWIVVKTVACLNRRRRNLRLDFRAQIRVLTAAIDVMMDQTTIDSIWPILTFVKACRRPIVPHALLI
jgi:hypothetical protein